MHDAVLGLGRLGPTAVDVLLQSWHGNLKGKTVLTSYEEILNVGLWDLYL